jgi:hypothetical protein
LPIVKWLFVIERNSPQQFAVAVGHMNVTRFVVANPPFKDISATPDFAHSDLFFWRQFADESPRDFGGLAVVVMDVKTGMTPIFKFHTLHLGFGRNAIGFTDRRVGFEKCKAILEINLERVFPSQIMHGGEVNHFGRAKRFFQA